MKEAASRYAVGIVTLCLSLSHPAMGLPTDGEPSIHYRLPSGAREILRYEVHLGELDSSFSQEVSLSATGQLSVRIPQPLTLAGTYEMQLSAAETDELIRLATLAMAERQQALEQASLVAQEDLPARPGRTRGSVGQIQTDLTAHQLNLSLDQTRAAENEPWRPMRAQLEWHSAEGRSLDRRSTVNQPLLENERFGADAAPTSALQSLQTSLKNWMDRASSAPGKTQEASQEERP